MKHVIIIGSGFGGLGSACLLAEAGYKVTVLEKNEMVGGRASVFTAQGFSFDMGPSWYLMPDVFEHFFELLGEDVHKHLNLVRLSPSYRVFYKDQATSVDIYGDVDKDAQTFEDIEAGAAGALRKYLAKAGSQYSIAKDRFMYKNYDRMRDFFTREMVIDGSKLSVLQTMDKYVKGYFKDQRLQKIMQYPLVFLGASPYNAPAIYNIMSHVDFDMGVFYPQGGLYEVTKALAGLAESRGATMRVNSPVASITVAGGKASGVVLADGTALSADVVISNADIRFTEQQLLDEPYRTKSEAYWDKRTLAPSALLIYLGVKGSYPQLQHHNLLFSSDWKQNFAAIFDSPAFPDDPSLYVCNPSKTDPSVAPAGYENLFVLVPIAPGLAYTEAELEAYADKMLETIENDMNVTDLRKNIVYKRLFSSKDFAKRYNATGGTALGLAHTLKQTAIFRPNNVNKKVKNLYYVGADTNPGIGMPTTLISAELMFKRLLNDASSGPLRKEQLKSNK